MGSALAKANGVANPKVALMNVGAETTKGNQEIQEAYVLLEAHKQINFCGFVEGNHLYRGDVDVIVCDGFVGNTLDSETVRNRSCSELGTCQI